MLFGDVFFLIGDWSLLSVRVNRIIFLPSLGYGFLALGCYCLFFLEGRSHLLRILPALHLFIGGILAFSDPSAHQAILIYLYLVSCLVSLTIFLLYGRLGNRRFLLFCVMILSLPFLVAFLTFVRVAFAILAILICRLFVIFVDQNINFLTALGWKRSTKIASITCLYWAPFLVLIFGTSLTGSFVHTQIENWLYGQAIVEACTPTSPERNLRADIDCTIDKEARGLGASLTKQFEEAAKVGAAKVSEFPAQIRDNLEKTIEPEPAAFRPQTGCKFWNIGCHIVNAIKHAALRSYQAARRSAIDRVYNEALESSKATGASITSVRDSVRAIMPNLVDATTKTLQQTARSAFNIADLVNVFFNILLALSIVKSFVYIFARLAYSMEPGIFESSINRAKKVARHKPISSSPEGFSIEVKNGQTYYKARSQPAGNFAQSISIPHPGSALIGRILHRRYVMDRSPEEPKGPLDFKPSAGQYFVKWDLQQGEGVVVRLKHLLLMDSTVKIHSTISLKLSTLLLGQIIYQVATGPGTILLSASGAPHVEEAKIIEPSGFESDRYIAWREETGFDVLANAGIANVYLSAIQLRATGPSFATVVDAVSKKKFSGAIRFAKNFLLPC